LGGGVREIFGVWCAMGPGKDQRFHRPARAAVGPVREQVTVRPGLVARWCWLFAKVAVKMAKGCVWVVLVLSGVGVVCVGGGAGTYTSNGAPPKWDSAGPGGELVRPFGVGRVGVVGLVQMGWGGPVWTGSVPSRGSAACGGRNVWPGYLSQLGVVGCVVLGFWLNPGGPGGRAVLAGYPGAGLAVLGTEIAGLALYALCWASELL